jgi:penicillin amidase
MFKTAAASVRIRRVMDLLSSGAPFSVDDFKRMQLDEYSAQAAGDIALFRDWKGKTPAIERARAMIAGWDAFLRRESAPAAIYMAWREAGAPGSGSAGAAMTREKRDSAVAAGLTRAIETLSREQGTDWAQWRWGRTNARSFRHPFVAAFDLPTVERGGGGPTVAANGATFREIIDVGDWDKSVVTMVPGQSGQPGSPFYGSLLPLWAKNEYFPLIYTPSAVSSGVVHRLVLTP